MILVDDALDEGEEHFDLQMLHAAPLLPPGQPVQIGTVQGTIEDDDPVPVYGQGRHWALVPTAGAGGTVGLLCSIERAERAEVTVHYGTDDRAPAGRAAGGLRTATAAVDYVPLDGTLMFVAGETRSA